MCILQIGELCKIVSEEMRVEEKEILWKEWCRIRDIFAHQYSSLDHQSAWDTVQCDIPELRAEVEGILQNRVGC